MAKSFGSGQLERGSAEGHIKEFSADVCILRRGIRNFTDSNLRSEISHQPGDNSGTPTRPAETLPHYAIQN